MKWYFASRTKHAPALSQVKNELRKQGHTILYDWTVLGTLKPYKANTQAAGEVARQIIEVLNDVDVFVLLIDEGGTDMFVELGAALHTWHTRQKHMRIYAVGQYTDRSLMHCHPAIQTCETVEQVFVKEDTSILTPDMIKTVSQLVL